MSNLFSNGTDAGIVDNRAPKSQNSRNRQDWRDDPNFVVADYWLNVGITRSKQTDEGEIVEKFISLPKGLGLETMKPLDTNVTSVDLRKQRLAQNNLWEQILKRAKTLKPGERVTITGLEIELYRKRSEAEAIQEDENEYIVDLEFA